MKFDPGKAFPHPVLRPESTDYPEAEFEVEMTLQREERSTGLQLRVEIALSDPDLQALITAGDAEYMIVLKSPATHERRTFRTRETDVRWEIEQGSVAGRIEFSPFIISARTLTFQAAGWHEDWSVAGSLELGAGTVLALDTPKEYYIDNAEESDIASFLVVRPGEVPDGQWQCDLSDKRIQILMSLGDYERFNALRAEPTDPGIAASIWNGMYLPALMHAAASADAVEADTDSSWYRSLDYQLTTRNLEPLGTKGVSRLEHAQALLRLPFTQITQLTEGSGP